MSPPPVRLLTLLAVFVGYAAWAAEPTAAPTPDEAALLRADAAARLLAKTLKDRVVEELGRGGAPAALAACNTDAAALTAGVTAESGVRVGRSSLRLRNPANASPDWVRAWLSAQGEVPAAAVAPYRAVVDGKARIVRPIAVEAPCLLCHGPREGLAPAVLTELQLRYPDDRATGYGVGDLRGALWAEVPVH